MVENPQAIIDRVKRWAVQVQLPIPIDVEVNPDGVVVIFDNEEDVLAWAWWFATDSLFPEGEFDYADRGPCTGLPHLDFVYRPKGRR